MAVEHIPIIKELQYRKVLKPAPIVPRYLQNSGASNGLNGCAAATFGRRSVVSHRLTRTRPHETDKGQYMSPATVSNVRVGRRNDLEQGLVCRELVISDIENA